MERIGRIKKYRNKPTKIYLTLDEQLTKLKSKNFTIDIDEKLAKDYLSKENYVQFFKSYEDSFIMWSDLISQKFRIYKNSEVEDISKILKSINYKYTKNNKFSDLIKFQDNDLKLRNFLLTEIHKIELIIKNELCIFIGSNIKSETWGNWLLRISSDYYKSEALNIVYKYKFYKKSIYEGVHNLSLGKLRNLVEIIFESDVLSQRNINDFTKSLFIDGLGKSIYFNDINHSKTLIWKLTFLHNIRNYISHSERFGTFMLKERLFRLKRDCKKKYLKFNLVKLSNKNNTIKDFTPELFKKPHKSNVEKIPLGYFIEIHNKINNTTTILENKIIKDFMWWFN